jgi:hypothetical protein
MKTKEQIQKKVQCLQQEYSKSGDPGQAVTLHILYWVLSDEAE